MRHVVEIDLELKELAIEYLANRRRELPLLLAARDRGDRAFLSGAGHKILGTAESYGFTELGPLAADLERAALAGDAAGMARALTGISAYLTDLELVFKECA
jgi:HPt (histidine-containing phosphotransfer) domain-containing protein